MQTKSEQMLSDAAAMPDSQCRDARLGFGESGELNAHLDECAGCRAWWAELIAAESTEREPALSGAEEVR